VWVLALLTVALIVTARAPSGDRPGLLSRISIPLLGVYVAGQIAYSIVFDHRYLAALGWQSLLPILVLGALVAAGSIQDRGKRQHRG
jgi:amino acid transporter